MSVTVGDLIERTYRTFLYPPDYEPALVQLNGALTSSATTLILEEFLVPEDEELLRIGSLIEADLELMRVTAWDNTTRVADVVRGQRGTAAAAHDDDIFLVLTPSYSRQSVFEALRDNITILSPQLYTISNANLVQIGNNVTHLDDELAVDVVEVWSDNLADTVDYDARIVDYHPLTGGRTLITNLAMGSLWVRYTRRMGVVTDEADTLEDLGVETVWENIIMVGASADLLIGRDIPQSQADYIGSVIQAENIPIGQRTSIAVALSRYRDLLLRRFQAEMRNEYKVKVHMRSPFEQRTRPWFG